MGTYNIWTHVRDGWWFQTRKFCSRLVGVNWDHHPKKGNLSEALYREAQQLLLVNVYIYIYIHIRVCLCVCVLF